ncbi:MAG: hypothetical protein ACRCYU_19395 [Nocardioides sp.]
MNRVGRFVTMAPAWVILLALAAGCGVLSADDSGDRAAVEILGVSGSPESSRREGGVNTCNMNPRVEADESASEVRLAVSVKKVDTEAGNDCADGVVVTLSQPLGQRTVVDDETNDALVVEPLED